MLKYHACWASLACVFPLFARAADPFSVSCPTPADLDPRIQYCSDNSYVTQAASMCSQKLVAAIDEASAELSAAFAQVERGDSSRQSSKFKFSNANYRRAQRKLNQLINQTTYNMQLIADYPKVMLDNPDENSPPVPCYTENFQALTQIVHDLDGKITQLKATSGAAGGLGDTSHTRADGVGIIPGLSIAGRNGIVGQSANPLSSVTGQLSDEGLPSGVTGRASGAIAATTAAAGSARAASAVTGGAAALVKSRQEQEASLKTFGSRISQGTTYGLGHSESMEVENLLDGAGASARAPASAEASPVAALIHAEQSEAESKSAEEIRLAHARDLARSTGHLGSVDTDLFSRIHRVLRR